MTKDVRTGSNRYEKDIRKGLGDHEGQEEGEGEIRNRVDVLGDRRTKGDEGCGRKA